MCRVCLSLAFVLSLVLCTSAAEPQVIKLWPGKAPDETKEVGPEKYQPQKSPNEIKRLTNVSEPTITIYPPAKEKANGTAIIVAPGGGHSQTCVPSRSSTRERRSASGCNRSASPRFF